MALYATTEELAAYIEDNPEAQLPGEPETERLLETAERAVDRVVGPWPRFSNGLKFDPTQLDTTQRAALSRAVCAASEHILTLDDPEFFIGSDDYAPGEVSILRRAQRISPKMLEELSGHGLIRRSGTVLPSPDPLIVISV